MVMAEAEARRLYRMAKAEIPAHLIKMFEAVVLDDLTLRRAARFSRCRDSRVGPMFAQAAGVLVWHCERAEISFANDRILER